MTLPFGARRLHPPGNRAVDHHKSHHNARRDAMAVPVATELHTKIDAARANLFRQLDGMDPQLDKSDAPGEWTAREVLSHLLFQSGFDPVERLKTFHAT